MVQTLINGSDCTDAAPLKVGDRVRVRPGVIPSLGWGNVRSTSVGRVVRMDGGERCDVDFPGHNNWHGKVPEIERVIDDPVGLLQHTLEDAESCGTVAASVLREARSKLVAVQRAMVETPLLDAIEVIEAALGISGANGGGAAAAAAATAASSAAASGATVGGGDGGAATAASSTTSALLSTRGPRPWLLEPTVTVSSTDGRHQASNLLDGKVKSASSSRDRELELRARCCTSEPGLLRCPSCADLAMLTSLCSPRSAQLETYWQSSGQSGQHWIEIASPRPGWPLGAIELHVKDFDNYSPSRLLLLTRTGADETTRWTPTKVVALSLTEGWVTLLTAAEAGSADRVRVEIHSNHDHGIDSKVAALRVGGAMTAAASALLIVLETALEAAHACPVPCDHALLSRARGMLPQLRKRTALEALAVAESNAVGDGLEVAIRQARQAKVERLHPSASECIRVHLSASDEPSKFGRSRDLASSEPKLGLPRYAPRRPPGRRSWKGSSVPRRRLSCVPLCCSWALTPRSSRPSSWMSIVRGWGPCSPRPSTMQMGTSTLCVWRCNAHSRLWRRWRGALL